MTGYSVIRKTTDRIYLLRVSGKGDDKANQNQLDVLQQYAHFEDARKFLEEFDVRMMKASSAAGEKLRKRWQRTYGLKVLNRAGRRDFLGLSVVIGRSRFIVYASTAAKMDEANGNAFTRHVCEAISDPAFHGMGDPEFMERRRAGEFHGKEHPSLVYAFDPTRFCRSMLSANKMYDEAAKYQVAFEAKDLQIDPAQGSHMRLMWVFLAYGSEMEAIVGKQRRFVGRLNKARAGFWPYREGMTPLGVTCTGGEDGENDEQADRRLVPDTKHIESVARMATLGLDPTMNLSGILHVLGTDHGVVSTDPKTLGTPVHKLDPAAAKRFFVRRKLEAYRDGEYALEFIGVTENNMRVGSGHVLKPRWDGLNADGNPDHYGSITYRIPMPKPTVTGPDGEERKGWLEGLTDDQERALWDRLIVLRGVDDGGHRAIHDIDEHLTASLTEQQRARLERDLSRVQKQSNGGRRGTRVVAIICPPYRDKEAGETGPRTFLVLRGQGQNCELRRETKAPKSPDGGLPRGPGKSELDATFAEETLTKGLADVITEGVRRLTDMGYQLAAHRITMSSALAAKAAATDPAKERTEQVHKLRTEAEELRAEARGYDKEIAYEQRQPQPDDERLSDLRTAADNARSEARRLGAEAEELAASPLSAAAFPQLPALDFADPRDLVVGLRGVYRAGNVPGAFLESLHVTVPRGVIFHRGRDLLEWEMAGDCVFTTPNGETVTVADCRAVVRSQKGRHGGGLAPDRNAAMAARRMRDGQPLAQVAQAGSSRSRHHVLSAIKSHLNSNNRIPDPALLQTAIDCPIVDTTRILHDYALAEEPPVSTGFAAHIVSVYTAAQQAHDGKPRTGKGFSWAYDLNIDDRLDQITILTNAPQPGRGVTTAALAAMVNPDNPNQRNALAASTSTKRVNGTYPASLRRLPAPGFPDGWYGKGTANLSQADKLVGLPACPYDDCREEYATVLCPAIEVLALGTMMLCKRCRRAATPPSHAMFQRARVIRFPQAYLDWSARQPRRTGQFVQCAGDGCTRDIGFGPGNTWRWDDSTDTRAWHDATCRVGTVIGRYHPCGYADCAVDEGGGPGQIREAERRLSREREWHTLACKRAERRHQKTNNPEYSRCIWSDCTLDEGNGPGSIRHGGKRRKAHNAACYCESRRATSNAAIRAWAREQGHDVLDTGRLPDSIVAAYHAATSDNEGE